MWWGDDLTVRIESHAPSGWKDGLASRGHRVQLISAFDPVAVGCAQIVTVATGTEATSRHCVGAADPRSPEGGVIADFTGEFDDPEQLAAWLSATVGVVEHGLFPPAIVSDIVVARGSDVERIRPNAVT